MHRYERHSLLVTSNEPFSEWQSVFSRSNMTVTAVDHSTSIPINGASYCRKKAERHGREGTNGWGDPMNWCR
jgi:DNA replication protein DnaC